MLATCAKRDRRLHITILKEHVDTHKTVLKPIELRLCREYMTNVLWLFQGAYPIYSKTAISSYRLLLIAARVELQKLQAPNTCELGPISGWTYDSIQ